MTSIDWKIHKKLLDAGGIGLWRPEYLEVVGNIHDNPELLKGEYVV